MEEGPSDANGCDREDHNPTNDEDGSSREEVVACEGREAVPWGYEVAPCGDEGYSYELREGRGGQEEREGGSKEEGGSIHS